MHFLIIQVECVLARTPYLLHVVFVSVHFCSFSHLE